MRKFIHRVFSVTLINLGLTRVAFACVSVSGRDMGTRASSPANYAATQVQTTEENPAFSLLRQCSQTGRPRSNGRRGSFTPKNKSFITKKETIMHKLKKAFILCAITTALAMLFSACGGDSGGSIKTPTPTPSVSRLRLLFFSYKPAGDDFHYL